MELSLGVVHSYQQRFETDTEDGEFVLRFDRVDQTGAPSSLAVLPAPFEITLPVGDDTVSRSVETGELVVSWDNQSDDSINISVYGDCFASYFALEQSDAGTHTIPLSYFKDNEYDAVSSCSAEVSVERRRTGSVDSEFAGGSSQGVQLRTVTIQMEP